MLVLLLIISPEQCEVLAGSLPPSLPPCPWLARPASPHCDPAQLNLTQSAQSGRGESWPVNTTVSQSVSQIVCLLLIMALSGLDPIFDFG